MRTIYDMKLGELLEGTDERRMLDFLMASDPRLMSEKQVIGEAVTSCFMSQVLEVFPDPQGDWSLFAILGVLDFTWDDGGLTEDQTKYRDSLIPKVYDLVAPLCKTSTDVPSLAEWLEKIKYMEDAQPQEIAEWWDGLSDEEKRDPQNVWLGIQPLE